MNPQYAILLDGGFVTKKLTERHKRYPTSADVQAECARIAAHDCLKGHDRLRIYFYDAPPSQAVLTNPVDGTKLDLGKSQRAAEATSLFQKLELCQDFALRMGETVVHGWGLGSKALDAMAKKP